MRQVREGCVLTIGNFDGVHIGHQEIIGVCRRLAEESRSEVVLMTFEPHPLAVLHPESAPGILTPTALKRELFASLGVGCRLMLEPRPDILALDAKQFVQRYLVDGIKPAVVVEGEDFYFGAGRTGTIETLRDMATAGGFEVAVVPARMIEIPDGQTVRVSSTMIRYMLGSGRVGDAAMALGGPYRLIGRVCPGRGIGRKLGFPTLNMKKPDQIVPAEGVYAGYVQLGDSEEDVCRVGERTQAVFSIGQARTFGDEHPLLIEAHLLVEGAEGLTGRWMAMDFVQFLRRQHKFVTPEELSKQIAKDCADARRLVHQAGARRHNGGV